MAFRSRLVLASFALAVGLAHAAEGQTQRVHVGPRLSYNFDLEEFAIGAQVGIPIANRLEFYPSFDYYFVDPGSAWGLNADLKYRLATDDAPYWFYLGAGLNLTGVSVLDQDDTNLGANLLGGVETLQGRIHPFGEARLTLSDGSFFQLGIGLNITF